MEVMKTEGYCFVGWENWLELMIFRHKLVKLGLTPILWLMQKRTFSFVWYYREVFLNRSPISLLTTDEPEAKLFWQHSRIPVHRIQSLGR